MKNKSLAFIVFFIELFLMNTKVFAQDPNFYIYLCFGQSNMEGFPGIQEQDKTNVDDRFRVLAMVDDPNGIGKKGTGMLPFLRCAVPTQDSALPIISGERWLQTFRRTSKWEL